MRRWCVLLLGLALLAGMVWLAGCEGDDGIQGEKGLTGPVGPGGYDPTALAPTDRYVSIGVTNATLNAVAGAKGILVTSDTGATTGNEAIVANYVADAPVIDGISGDESEWGEKSSKIALEYYNLEQDPTLEDPNILEVTARAAYDAEYIYFLLSWKEVTISVKDSQGGDSILVLASPSFEMNELLIDVLHPDTICVEEAEGDCIRWDTTFTYLRTYAVLDSIDTVFCVEIDPVTHESLCYVDTFSHPETTLVWKSTEKAEDRVGVIWSMDDDPSWANGAFDLLFRTDGYQPALAGDAFMDVWLWGAATSAPSLTADDYYISASDLAPDAGGPPYMSNYLLPDSVPRYQNLRDPNARTSTNLGAIIYPLWFYDAVGFKQMGWALNRPAYVPGIVNLNPSGSRADIQSAATFDNGLWILELKRARRTYSGDDLAF